MRIAIVDDDVWIRTGRQTGLEQYTDIEVVASLSPTAARTYEWEKIDVALVDAHDGREVWDRYPGVAVVEAIRRYRRPQETTVIVISGRIFDPILRLRMAEAGADYFYSHLDAPDPESLAELIRHPERNHQAEPGDNRELAQFGLRVWSRPNQAIKWVSDARAESYFTEAGTQKTTSASRRALSRARDEVARLAHLDPSLGDSERKPGDVTWRDVSRFVNRALGRDSHQQ